MIHNETEYRLQVERYQAALGRLRDERAALGAQGYTAGEVERAMQPLESFHAQLGEEIESYERLMRGDFEELKNFQGLGRQLVALRVYVGMTQGELAERLGVPAAQVARDERNEYHGITVERANRVIEALGVELHTYVSEPEPRRRPAALARPTTTASNVVARV